MFKLLAVDVPTAGGSEQRLFVEGDEQAYAKGGIISELRDPFLQVGHPPPLLPLEPSPWAPSPSALSQRNFP